MTGKPSDLQAGDLGMADARAAGPGAGASVEQLTAEIMRLRARIAELEAGASGARAGGAGAAPEVGRTPSDESHRLLRALVEHGPNLIFIKDVNYRFVLVNQRLADYSHKTPEEIIGLTDHDFLPRATADQLRADEERVVARGQPLEYEEEVHLPVGSRTFFTVKFPIYDARGMPLGIGAFITDISERKRLEAERLALKEEVIATQKAALREQSTPLVPLAEGVLAMPIMGTIDDIRAQEILEALLEGISRQGARTAILDITGVRVVDTRVANALVSAARAARLLGARVVLTGISPSVAQTLVELGANMGDIVTLGTLASGIAYALRR